MSRRSIFPPMERRVRQVWQVLHIISSVGWLGTILVAISLSVAGMRTDDHDRVTALHTAMDVVAGTFLLPGSALMLLTGVLLGLGTKWGLVRWWWVAVKFAIGLALFVASTMNLPFGMLCVIAVLCFVSALLSVIKPWGRINWRRPAAAVPTPREHVRESTS